MTDHIETLARRIEGAMASDRLDGNTDGKFFKAVVWEIDAEAWERGVMFKGGVGTIKPERPPNPYLASP